MMTVQTENGFRKVALWENEVPIAIDSDKKIEIEVEAGEKVWQERILCVEVKLNPRHASNYAMLCMQYKHIPTKKTRVVIHYGKSHKCESTDSLFNKKAIVGLDDFFAKEICAFLKESPRGFFPEGVLEIIGGAYDEVGSSYISFKNTIELLKWLFENYDKYNENSIGDVILNKLYDYQN